MSYCTHQSCRSAAFIEMAYLAVSLNRADILKTAIEARHEHQKVRCRENRDYTDAPLPMPEGV